MTWKSNLRTSLSRMAKARSQAKMWKQPKGQEAHCPSNATLRFVMPANTALSIYPSLFILKPLPQTPVPRTTNLMQRLLKASSGTALVGAKPSPLSQPAASDAFQSLLRQAIFFLMDITSNIFLTLSFGYFAIVSPARHFIQ